MPPRTEDLFESEEIAVVNLPLDFFDNRANVFNDWTKTIIKSSRASLSQYGHVTPVLLFLRPDLERPGLGYQQVLLDIRQYLTRPARRASFAIQLPGMLSVERAICAMLVQETWMYQDNPDRVLQVRRRYLNIGDFPPLLRQQAVYFRFETSTRAWTKYLLFKRHPGMRPRVLGEEQAVDGYAYTGAFMGISHFLYKPAAYWARH
jgi:hypothetical protein